MVVAENKKLNQNMLKDRVSFILTNSNALFLGRSAIQVGEAFNTGDLKFTLATVDAGVNR